MISKPRIDWTRNRALGVYLEKSTIVYKYSYVNGERRLDAESGYWVFQVGFFFGSLIIQFNQPKLDEN